MLTTLQSNLHRLALATASIALSAALTGCTPGMPSAITQNPKPPSDSHGISGLAMGGLQPISGAKVYLYAVGTTGYGSASTSLLSNSSTDYVTTSSTGSFNITNLYTCPNSDSLVYLLVSGGDAGAGTNSALTLMAALGNCETLRANANSIHVTVNEGSTVAAVYALAPFINSATEIGAPASNLGGITRAFTLIANTNSLTYGMPYATTTAGNGLVGSRAIDTVADFISLCVNSNGSVTGGTSTLCDRVFNAATYNSVVPANTLMAALSIARHPSNNVATIVNSIPPIAPFQPVYTAPPSDLMFTVQYTGGGINTPQGVAIDSTGNAWIANAVSNAVTKLTGGTGAAAFGDSGFLNSSFDAPSAIAIANDDTVFVANCGDPCSSSGNQGSLTHLTNISGSSASALTRSIGTGGPTSLALYFIFASVGNSVEASAPYVQFNSYNMVLRGTQTGAFLSGASGIAADIWGNFWITSPVTNSLTGTSGSAYQGSLLSYPSAVATDKNLNVWVTNQTGNSLSVFDNSATPLFTQPLTGGGLSAPNAIALDGDNSVWISNGSGSISHFANDGTALSPSTGYLNSIGHPNSIATDPSGNIWITVCGSACLGSGTDPGSVYQVVGAASPEVTPISAAVEQGTIGTRP